MIGLPGWMGTASERLMACDSEHSVRRDGGHHVPTVAIGREWRTVAETLVSEIEAFPEEIHLASTPDEGVDWILDQLNFR